MHQSHRSVPERGLGFWFLERWAKEVKHRAKVAEVFCGEEGMEKILYLALSHMNEAFRSRRLQGFTEIIK
jgi:transposase-like protein